MKECKKCEDNYDKLLCASMPPRAGKSLNSFDNYQIMDKIKELRYIINEQKIAIDDCMADYKKLEKENEELRRYVYHCPQTCNKILAYLRKCEVEDVKVINDAMYDDKYFDEEIDNLRSWE